MLAATLAAVSLRRAPSLSHRQRAAAALDAELARTSAEAASLSGPAVRALAPVLTQARRETATALRAWLRREDGAARYTAQKHRVVLAHLSAALSTVDRLDPTLLGALTTASRAAGPMAARHVTAEIARFDRRFGGAERPLPLNVARIVATGQGALIPRFRTSAARYAVDVRRDIGRELAVSILRGESIADMTARLAKLGGPRGPVALQGVAGEPGAVVEHIAEGLFRRYGWWGERIARTETQRAYNEQVDETLREAREVIPDLRRRWDASLDLRVCKLCQDLHGTTADIGGEFPGGVTDAPRHACCRCRCGAWRDEWAEFFRSQRA